MWLRPAKPELSRAPSADRVGDRLLGDKPDVFDEVLSFAELINVLPVSISLVDALALEIVLRCEPQLR